MNEWSSRIEELLEVQREILDIFFREECSIYEANLIVLRLSEQIENISRGKDPYESRFIHNKAESDNKEVLEDDMITNPIQNVVNEILENIGGIFISKKLFHYECEMILARLAEQIKQSREKNGG